MNLLRTRQDADVAQQEYAHERPRPDTQVYEDAIEEKVEALLVGRSEMLLDPSPTTEREVRSLLYIVANSNNPAYNKDLVTKIIGRPASEKVIDAVIDAIDHAALGRARFQAAVMQAASGKPLDETVYRVLDKEAAKAPAPERQKFDEIIWDGLADSVKYGPQAMTESLVVVNRLNIMDSNTPARKGLKKIALALTRLDQQLAPPARIFDEISEFIESAEKDPTSTNADKLRHFKVAKQISERIERGVQEEERYFDLLESMGYEIEGRTKKKGLPSAFISLQAPHAAPPVIPNKRAASVSRIKRITLQDGPNSGYGGQCIIRNVAKPASAFLAVAAATQLAPLAPAHAVFTVAPETANPQEPEHIVSAANTAMERDNSAANNDEQYVIETESPVVVSDQPHIDQPAVAEPTESTVQDQAPEATAAAAELQTEDTEATRSNGSSEQVIDNGVIIIQDSDTVTTEPSAEPTVDVTSEDIETTSPETVLSLSTVEVYEKYKQSFIEQYNLSPAPNTDLFTSLVKDANSGDVRLQSVLNGPRNPYTAVDVAEEKLSMASALLVAEYPSLLQSVGINEMHYDTTYIQLRATELLQSARFSDAAASGFYNPTQLQTIALHLASRDAYLSSAKEREQYITEQTAPLAPQQTESSGTVIDGDSAVIDNNDHQIITDEQPNNAQDTNEAEDHASNDQAHNQNQDNNHGQSGDEHASGDDHQPHDTSSDQGGQEQQTAHESDSTGQYDVLLNLIARFESGGNYNAYYGHGDNHSIDFTSMTVREVIDWQTDFRDSGSYSTAVGKYQFLQRTLVALMEQHQIPYDTQFDKEFQDQLAYYLLEKRDLHGFLNGDISAEVFAHNLSMEWASLPSVTGPHPGDSYYQNDGLNHAHISVAEILNAIDSIKPGSDSHDSGEDTPHADPEQSSLLDEILNYTGVHEIVSHTDTGVPLPDNLAGVTYYSQWDQRWYDKAYEYSGGSGHTMASSGCGPTTQAMALSTLTGETITPIEMAQWNINHGYRVSGGTSHAAFTASAEAFGVKSENIAVSTDAIREAIKRGALVIVNGEDTDSSTPATSAGHIYLVRGVTDDGKFEVSDANSITKSLTPYEYNEIVGPASVAVALYPKSGQGHSEKQESGQENEGGIGTLIDTNDAAIINENTEYVDEAIPPVLATIDE